MKNKVIRPASLVSSFDDKCEGALDPSRYVVLINVTAAKVKRRFGDPACCAGLDAINAFDRAERDGAYLGQINLIEVSSFCGPGGLIWGFDMAWAPGLYGGWFCSLRNHLGESVPVYDGAPLAVASQALLGTAESKVFPIMPGSLCPAAYKSAVSTGPGRYYSVLGIGIAEPREEAACIFMEDCGRLPDGADRDALRPKVMRTVAESVLAVAANQGTRCTQIFVVYDDVEVGPDEAGSVVAMAPYVRLARRAWPRGGLKRLLGLRLAEWQAAIAGRRR